MNRKRIAIVSNRYLKEDLRGSEELPKQITQLLIDIFDVDILTSDIMDLQPLTSPIASRSMDIRKFEDDGKTIYRFRSHPLISSSAYVASKILSHFSSAPGISYKSFLDFLGVIGWGPFIPNIYDHILNSNYDLVYGSTFPSTPSFLAFEAAIDSNIPFVYAPYLHYNLNEHTDNMMVKLIIKGSTAIIAMTDSEKRKLISMGASDKSTFVVPAQYDMDRMKNMRVEKEKAKKFLGLENKFVILTVPHPAKGGLQTLDAAALLSDFFDNVYVLSIGNVKRSYLNHVKFLKDKHKNLNIIDFGWVDTQTKYILNSAADVFSMPSVTDSFGLSYLDAWSCHTPVIAARDTSADDLVSDGENGFLVSFGNAGELFIHLKALYLGNYDSKEMGMRGHQSIKERFDPNVVKNKYIEVFEFAMQ